MTSYVADNKRTGFDYWAKKNNLKEAAKTFSYLSQHNLLNYEEFQNHISNLEASIHAADNNIQQVQQAIQNQKVIQKHCEVYRACRDVILAEKEAPDRLLYRKQHRAEYQLHETTLKELAEFGIHKLPSAENCSANRWNWKKNCPQPKKKSRISRSNRSPCI